MIDKQKFKSSKTGKIISVGPLEINSGFDLLIQSWINVNEKLEIIGKGSQESSLNKLIKSHDLNKKIKIERNNSVKKINERFQIAKCLIIPYLEEENLDLIRQALNYEIPIIGTDLHEISKIIPREFLAKPKNLNSLKSVIEEMIPMLSQFDLSAIKRAVIENY